MMFCCKASFFSKLTDFTLNAFLDDDGAAPAIPRMGKHTLHKGAFDSAQSLSSVFFACETIGASVKSICTYYFYRMCACIHTFCTCAVLQHNTYYTFITTSVNCILCHMLCVYGKCSK